MQGVELKVKYVVIINRTWIGRLGVNANNLFTVHFIDMCTNNICETNGLRTMNVIMAGCHVAENIYLVQNILNPVIGTKNQI